MTYSKPLVSIGMPVYNGELFIGRALDSLLTQDYENFELIISDNASTDGTEEICRSYKLKDARIQYHRNVTNAGALRNFRRALELSSGKYFMWAAHDDLWEKSFISKLIEAFLLNGDVALSCCDYNAVSNTTGEVVSHDGNPLPSFSISNTIFENTIAMIEHPHSPFVYGIFRADKLKSTRFVRRSTYFDFGDLFLLNEISLLGKVQLTPEILFHAGIKGVARPPVSFARRRIPGFKFAYAKYYIETLRCIARSNNVEIKEKVHSSLLLTNQVLNLILGHERIPKFLMKAIRFGSYFLRATAEKFFTSEHQLSI